MRGLVAAVVIFGVAPAARAGPGDAYDQAEAARAAGDCATAIPLYRAFLDTAAPADPRAPAARAELGRCRARGDVLAGNLRPAETPRSRNGISWTLVGVGTTLALVGTAAFVHYRGLVVEFNETRDYHTKYLRWADVDTSYRLQQAGVAVALLGAGLAGWGVYRLTHGCEVAATPAGGGVQVTLGGHF